LGASTIPEVEGVVEGVGTESSDTEWVVGNVEAVGEVFDGLPFTLFNGWGILVGPEGDDEVDAGIWGPGLA
jgi:hypothetical protein